MRIISLALIVLLAMTASAEMLEIPVLRLVVKNLHPENTTQPAEASRRHEQRSLRYPPCASSRSSFIDTHKGKGGEVYDDQDAHHNEDSVLSVHQNLPRYSGLSCTYFARFMPFLISVL